MFPVERYDVIGCSINCANIESAIGEVLRRVQDGTGGYVCFTNVHCAVMAHRDSQYRNIINTSFMTLPDGKPLYWVARSRGLAGVGHVPGPDLLPALLAIKHDPPLRHFFYGSRREVLAALVNNLKSRYSGIEIVGTYSPPFRPLSEQERRQVLDEILRAQPDIVWVGLGAPKQEQWMAENWHSLKPAVLMGVGAAFDFHAGAVKRAPSLFTRIGMEWAYRLASEPRRLWRRYLVTNSLFLCYLILGMVKKKKTSQR